MPLVMTDAGMLKLVQREVGLETVDADWSVGLYVNNLTPDRSTTMAAFVSPSWPGYARIDLDPAQWEPPNIVDDRAEIVYGTAPLSWTNTGSTQTVYGYYVRDNDDNGVIWAERFATPRTLTIDSILYLDLVFYLRNDPSPP